MRTTLGRLLFVEWLVWRCFVSWAHSNNAGIYYLICLLNNITNYRFRCNMLFVCTESQTVCVCAIAIVKVTVTNTIILGYLYMWSFNCMLASSLFLCLCYSLDTHSEMALEWKWKWNCNAELCLANVKFQAN